MMHRVERRLALLGLGGLFATGAPTVLGSPSVHANVRSASDSTFNPDGPWAAVQWIRLGDFEIGGFTLNTLAYDASTGRYSPRAVPQAFLDVGRVDVARTPAARCRRPLVRPDSVALDCPNTGVGRVRIDGVFLDSLRAGLPDTVYVIHSDREPGSLVVRALVRVDRSGRTVYSAVHEFVQTQGD